MDIRRALSIGGAAVVAAVVGAACSFAFSGAIALNDAAGVQVSESPVIVPSTRTVGTEFRTPRSPDAAGPEIVPAPEPHDLGPTSPRGPSAGSSPDAGSPGSPADRPGASGGDGQGASRGEGSVGTGSPGGGLATAPGLAGGDSAPGAGEQSPAHSNRDWAHQHAPGLNKAPGSNDARGKGQERRTEECDQDSRDHARGSADRSSHPDASCAGGG